MFTGANNAISASLYKHLPFDFIRDTVPIGMFTEVPNMMVVANAMPVKTVAEFIDYCKANPGKISFASSIFSGVLDRFPELQIVSAENNIGWLPYYLQRMDRAFERQGISAGFANKLKPSEYFQRQMWATYIDDYVGVANRHFIGVDKLMWSSDYPHQASTWPHSQDVVARDFKDASPEDRFKITRANAARLYGFDA